jgi:uroporphyrinogen-III synthase
MKFSHVLLTRPRPDSLELAARLAPLGFEAIVQPAFHFLAVDAGSEQPAEMQLLADSGPDGLLIFTSPRAVEHGLPQVSRDLFSRLRVAAIGPATARALAGAGVRNVLQAASGYTSEDLLSTLRREAPGRSGARAFIMAAPDGRKTLARGLEELGFDSRLLMVYRAEAESLDREALVRLNEAGKVLSVWTSANAMRALAQRFPPAAWFRVCQGEWLVTSERLARLARAYGPSAVHLASGPGNDALLTSIRNLA